MEVWVGAEIRLTLVWGGSETGFGTWGGGMLTCIRGVYGC